MKVKVDENLPETIAAELRSLGHDATTVVQQGMTSWSDEDIWPVVVAEQRFLITQDVGFADARRVLKAGSPGVLLLRIKEEDFDLVIARVVELYTTEDVETWKGCSVSSTLETVRVRRSLAP